MSVSVKWRPTPPKDARCFVGGMSHELEALRRTFGHGAEGSVTITASDCDRLRAMAAAATDGKFYEQVMQAALDHEAIEVWGEW